MTDLANQFPTLIDSIEINAARNPKAPAIVFPNCAILTYGNLLQQVAHFSSELRRVGIGAHSRVAVAVADGPELAIAIVAIACCAAVLPIDPKLTRAEIEDLFDTCRIDALITSGEIGLLAREIAAQHGALILITSRHESGLGVSLRSSSPNRTPADIAVRPHNPALILRTSGTTGRPKLVTVTHENLLAMAARLQQWFDLGPNDRVLSVMPLHYAQGLKVTLFVPLIIGGSIAIPSRSSGFDFFNWLSELKPTWYSAGPTLHHLVLNAGQPFQGQTFSHSLRFINSAAAPLSDSKRAELEHLFEVPVLDSYGLSEAGLVAANSVSPDGRKHGTVGKFLRGELAIRMEDGTIIDEGGPGEIVLRGPGLSPRYIDNHEANYETSARDWFGTGDLGRIDADGFLTLCGRIKEIIVRGGEKVSPAEIDAALLRHPAVVEAAAFPVPHPRLGEDVAAAVVLRPGITTTSQELRQFLRNTLSVFKLPRRIHVVTSMPKGPTGKAARNLLSDTFGIRAVDHTNPQWLTTLEIDISEIWKKLLKCEIIGPEDDFFELGGDSLLATQMLLELERLVGVTLPETLLFENATVRKLAESVVPFDCSSKSLLLQVRPGTGGKPFIFIDGDFRGGGYYVRNLALLLGSSLPIYTLRSFGLFGDKVPSIEEIARHYKQLLDDAGIAGPISLGGHCNGALIALELAHQLEADGREVESIAMIEAISLNARPSFRFLARGLETALSLFVNNSERRRKRIDSAMFWIWRNVDSAIQQFGEKSLLWRVLPRWAIYRIAQSLFKSRKHSKAFGNLSVPQSEIGLQKNESAGEAEDLRIIFYRRMASYIPKRVKAGLLIILSESSAQKQKFLRVAWQLLGSSYEVITVPGSHLSCVSTIAHADTLVRELRKHLEVQ